MNARIRLAWVGIDHPHGCGWRRLFWDLEDQVEGVAICNPELGLSSLEERYSDLPRFQSLDELVAWGRFDAAVVALSDQASSPAAQVLAQAGKHLLLEKPGARSASEFRPIVSTLEQNQLSFQAGYLWRYDEGANRLKAMAEEGRFGRLSAINIGFVTSCVQRRDPAHYLFDPAVSGGGFFHWLGCHMIDLLPYITGQTIRSVFAQLGNVGRTPIAVEDGGSVLMRLSDDTIVSLTGGYWLPRPAGMASWSIFGTQRSVHWDLMPKVGRGHLHIQGPQPHWESLDEDYVIPEDKTPGYGGWMGRQAVEDWLRQIRDPSRPCRSSARSVLSTLEVLDAIATSAREGVQISLER